MFEDGEGQDDYYEISYRNHKRLRWEDNRIVWGGIWSENPEVKVENLEHSFGNDLIFTDKLFDGQKKTVTVHYFYSNNIDSVDIILRHVSEDYFEYKKSLARHQEGKYDDVIWGGAGVFPLYSNIDNGYGVFAGYAETRRTFYSYRGGQQ